MHPSIGIKNEPRTHAQKRNAGKQEDKGVGESQGSFFFVCCASTFFALCARTILRIQGVGGVTVSAISYHFIALLCSLLLFNPLLQAPTIAPFTLQSSLRLLPSFSIVPLFASGLPLDFFFVLPSSDFVASFHQLSIMGQVNSTQASSSQPVVDPLPPTPPPSSSSSTSASLPSVEDMRNLTNRILASTNDALKNLRENMPSLELPTVLSSSSSSSSSASDNPLSAGLDTAAGAQEMAAVNAANMTDGLGFSTDPTPALVVAGGDQQQVLIYRSFGDQSQGREGSSVTDLIKIHYQLSVDWVKSNAMTVTLAAVGLGTVLIVGTVAVKAVQAHRREKRRLRVLRGQDGRVKRELVVITHLGTLEGASLALSLEQDGFIVFGGVADATKVAEVEKWGRPDILTVVVDATKVKKKRNESAPERKRRRLRYTYILCIPFLALMQKK